MMIQQGSSEIPFLFTAHHASHDYHEFAPRVALNDEQRIRFSDYGTDLTVPDIGIASLVATHSRALGDLNRDPDDPNRFAELDYGRPDRHPVWLPSQSLSDEDKSRCQRDFYEPFHQEIINQLKQQPSETVVVAWDNTAHYDIGENDAGESVVMPMIVLSNRGHEGKTTGNNGEVSCDPRLLRVVADTMRSELENAGLENDVQLNLVFKGGFICRTYSSWRNAQYLEEVGVVIPVQSFQIEYDTRLTHDQHSLEVDHQAVEQFKSVMSKSLVRAWEIYTLN